MNICEWGWVNECYQWKVKNKIIKEKEKERVLINKYNTYI